MARIEELYSELYDSDQPVTMQTDPEEVLPIMSREVAAALKTMKNGSKRGKDHVNIETLKAGHETIAKQLDKLCAKGITERRIPRAWKEANMMIIYWLLSPEYILATMPVYDSSELSRANRIATVQRSLRRLNHVHSHDLATLSRQPPGVFFR